MDPSQLNLINPFITYLSRWPLQISGGPGVMKQQSGSGMWQVACRFSKEAFGLFPRVHVAEATVYGVNPVLYIFTFAQ